MDKYFMWIHYEQLHNHNKAKHNKTVCIFLGIYCNYMQVEVHAVAMAGMVVSMTTPVFHMTVPHCLIFDYEVRESGGTPVLEVHARMTDHMLSGKIMWTSQDYNLQGNKAHITLSSENASIELPYVLDFVGRVAEPTSIVIRIANIGFSGGQCSKGQTLSFFDGNPGIAEQL